MNYHDETFLWKLQFILLHHSYPELDLLREFLNTDQINVDFHKSYKKHNYRLSEYSGN